MIDQDIDRIFRDKLFDCEEIADDDIWSGIEGVLDRKERLRMIRRRFIWGGSSAAACLLAGLFLFSGFREGEQVRYAGVVSEPEYAVSLEPLPIAEQIKSFGTRVAYVPSAQVSPADDAVYDMVKDDESRSAAQKPSSAAGEKRNSSTADEETLAADDGWWEEEERHVSTRHTAFSLNTNIGAVASNGSFVADFGPAHSASQSGKSSALSIVVPVSEPVFSMPLSFGFQFKTELYNRLYIGAGVSYTYLESSYEALVKGEKFRTSSQLHYVGIPVSLYYNFVDTDRLGVYVDAGFMVDKCLKSRYVYGSNTSSEKVAGLQCSAALGVGIEYRFVEHLGVYFDPGFAYYFDNSQPLSIRTSQPLQARFEAGLRFNL